MKRKGHIKRFLMHIILACFCFIHASGSAEAVAVPSYERLQPVTQNMNSPTAVALDKYECIIVAESIGNRVMIYSQSGHYLGQITGLARPISVAVDDNIRIYIGNKDSGSVAVYDSELNFLFKLGSGDGEFGQPSDIAIASNGYIYVVDNKKNSMRIYSTDGTLYSSFGTTGNGAGQFYNPSSIAINKTAEELMVLDHSLVTDMFGSQVEGARVQVFTMTGQFKRSFVPYGNEIGQLFRPQHLEVDGQGRVYITDTFHNVVLIYDSNGTYLGDLYNLENPLRVPMGITIGGSNRIFIASLLSGKVELYGIDSYTQMVVSPLDIDFEASEGGASPGPQRIEVANNGTGVLSWTANTQENWINFSESSGETPAGGVSALDIGVIANGLAPGSYRGSVNISASSGARETVNITLEVLPTPELSVSPASLTFSSTNGAEPAGRTLLVDNVGAGAMNWTAATDSGWIVMNKAAGSAPDTIGVGVDITALSAGTYNGTIIITGEGALSSPEAIPVTLNIFEVTGEIQVTANIAGASFVINGPQSYSGSGASWSQAQVPIGTYSIVYGNVEGYAKPSSASRSLQPQGTIVFHGEYISEDPIIDSVSGKDEIGVFRNGDWYLDSNGTAGWNAGDTKIKFGIEEDIPVTGDWDGNGYTDMGIYRNGWWYLDTNGTAGWNEGDTKIKFGIAGDIPVTGDWNGDGYTDLGIYRNGWWYLDSNGTAGWNEGDAKIKFGITGDIPVTGDWDRDGYTDMGVFHDGWWYLDTNGTAGWNEGDTKIKFGIAGDIPVTGDWNADGYTDLGIYRNGWWYLDSNGTAGWNAGDTQIKLGIAGDIPVTGKW